MSDTWPNWPPFQMLPPRPVEHVPSAQDQIRWGLNYIRQRYGLSPITDWRPYGGPMDIQVTKDGEVTQITSLKGLVAWFAPIMREELVKRGWTADPSIDNVYRKRDPETQIERHRGFWDAVREEMQADADAERVQPVT